MIDSRVRELVGADLIPVTGPHRRGSPVSPCYCELYHLSVFETVPNGSKNSAHSHRSARAAFSPIPKDLTASCRGRWARGAREGAA
jgi:hypothetical protein